MIDLDKEFEKNELAYLAFTSKIERPIRDKFAWVMHRKLSKYYHVTREYGIPGRKDKIDFAIIDKKNTEKRKVLIEFKAISIPSSLKSKQTLKHMEDDFRKMELFQVKKGAKPELYFVQLVNIPEKKLEECYRCQIAPSHFEKINNYFEKNDMNKLKEEVTGEWENKLRKKDFCFKHSSLDGGKFYSNSMEILFWIIWKK